MKTARESKDVHNPHGDRFIAILELFGDNPTTTGNYTCQSLGNHVGLEKSVFIFWDGQYYLHITQESGFYIIMYILTRYR